MSKNRSPAKAKVATGVFCAVCHVEAESNHLNYGGRTCFSCRAFFRRAVQGGHYPDFRCPKSGDCEVNLETRRRCQQCRFRKCREAGMQVELVLDEGARKVRFRKVIQSNLEEAGPRSRRKYFSSVTSSTQEQEESPRPDDAQGTASGDRDTQEQDVTSSTRGEMNIPQLNWFDMVQAGVDDGLSKLLENNEAKDVKTEPAEEEVEPPVKKQRQAVGIPFPRAANSIQGSNLADIYDSENTREDCEVPRFQGKFKSRLISLFAQEATTNSMTKPAKKPVPEVNVKLLPHKKFSSGYVWEKAVNAMREKDSFIRFKQELINLHRSRDAMSQNIIYEHMNSISQLFGTYARDFPDFKALDSATQDCLLCGKYEILFTLLIAKYLGESDAKHQLSWLLTTEEHRVKRSDINHVGIREFFDRIPALISQGDQLRARCP